MPCFVVADARSWTLPWITGDVCILGADEWVTAEDGRQGEVVIRQRYPYQALTVWQSEGFGTAEWCGNSECWSGYFTGPEGGYLQGDLAIRHPEGAFTFHGRSDEVRSRADGRRIEVCQNSFNVWFFALHAVSPHPRTHRYRLSSLL